MVLLELDSQLMDRLRSARMSGIRWIMQHIDDDGVPLGASMSNTWWRIPWALILAGEAGGASAVLSWAERHALTDDGDLRPGPYGGDGPATPVYQLSPLAIAAWLLGHYDTAESIMDRLRTYQHPDTGGVFDLRDRTSDDIQEMLKTSQLGISALVTGRRDTSEAVHSWLRYQFSEQKELPDRLYTCRSATGLVTEYRHEQAFARVVDFTQPRQAYFHPGIAAAFLAGYATQLGDHSALELARSYLMLNINGGDVQFEDPASVQICKFGWGAAAMMIAGDRDTYLPHVLRMAEWFMDRQDADGSWAPSGFMIPVPGDTDRQWKTAEHLMEMAMIETALAGTPPAREPD